MSYFRTFLLVTLCFFSLNTWAADLYVSTAGSDSNSGTAAAPFRTVQKGANMATPGTTVHVAPGAYIEAIVSNVNGTALARIRFVSDVKWAAKLKPSAGAGTVWQSTGGYTDIDGFEIDGTGNTTTRQGIYLTGGNSTVKNTLVHHIAISSGCDDGGGAGIVADQNRGTSFGNYDFIGNIVHHIGNSGCAFIQGIYHSSTGSIKNNLVYAVGAYGIHLWHDDHNIDIVNNTVFGCGNGIVYGGADQYNYFGPADYIRIYNNIIFDNTGTGISENSVYGSNNVIQNNLVFQNGTNYNVSGVTGATQKGEIAADPQFVNYIRSGGGDYRLKSTSPAINKGTSTLAPVKDLDGINRPQGTAFDIGAYEYGSLAPTPIPDGVPAISLSTKSLTFASQLTGTSSAVQFVTITNSGTAPLVFGADSISGDFAFANLGTCDVNLDVGSSCTYSVKFSPTTVGQKTGALIINTNVPIPLNITLSGSGFALVTDSIAPLTKITSPATASTVAIKTYVNISAQASDNTSVKTVKFYVNGSLKCTKSTPPYQCAWYIPRYRGKIYILNTKAYDAAGNEGTSSPVKITSK